MFGFMDILHINKQKNKQTKLKTKEKIKIKKTLTFFGGC